MGKEILKPLKESFDYIKQEIVRKESVCKAKKKKRNLRIILTSVLLPTIITSLIFFSLYAVAITLLSYGIGLILINDIEVKTENDTKYSYKTNGNVINFDFKKNMPIFHNKMILMKHSNFYKNKDDDNLYDEFDCFEKKSNFVDEKELVPKTLNKILSEKQAYYKQYKLPHFSISENQLTIFLQEMYRVYNEFGRLRRFTFHMTEIMRFLYSYSLIYKLTCIDVLDLIKVTKYLINCGIKQDVIDEIKENLDQKLKKQQNKVIKLQKSQ